jgi:hypothetical protein
MKKLKIEFTNCYGIRELKKELTFQNTDNGRAVAIYAPNGSMKTSFAKTIDQLRQGLEPKDERFNRPSSWVLEADGRDVDPEQIYVLYSAPDISREPESMSAILVNPSEKKRFDEIFLTLEKQKNSLVIRLNRRSVVHKKSLEQRILEDFNATDLYDLLSESDLRQSYDLGHLKYEEVLSEDALGILQSPEFVENARVFGKAYREVFERQDSPFKRGVFNPKSAETAVSALRNSGYFEAEHRVHFAGDESSLTAEQVNDRLSEVQSAIDSDGRLKELQRKLGEKTSSRKLNSVLEGMNPSELDIFLEEVSPGNLPSFRRKLWCHYLSEDEGLVEMLDYYRKHRDELRAIEARAANEVSTWRLVVGLFNRRFVDLPFTLRVTNPSEAALGKSAKVVFDFKDEVDDSSQTLSHEALGKSSTLSQGEMRALHLLNFIFDMKDREQRCVDSLVIIDDPADSFDYKNKHAILQYLKDLSEIERFRLIILTHNFDFYRSLSERVVDRKRCFMANQHLSAITLEKADGIQNIFINKWKMNIHQNKNADILYASVPFVRNLIEYISGDQADAYKDLCKLLHWQEGTSGFTVGSYFEIYNRLFVLELSPPGADRKMVEVLFERADLISGSDSTIGLDLEQKVLLSIAIRIKAERFITDELRRIKGDPTYWSTQKVFGKMLPEYLALKDHSQEARPVLERVGITVSSNIHLNSFMFEPILDLTIDHLRCLYQDVSKLSVDL